MIKPVLKLVLKTAPLFLASMTYLSLAACGTKGPLYIPEQRYPQGLEKDIDIGVNNDAANKDAQEANIDAAPQPAQ